MASEEEEDKKAMAPSSAAEAKDSLQRIRELKTECKDGRWTVALTLANEGCYRRSEQKLEARVRWVARLIVLLRLQASPFSCRHPD